MNTLTYKGYTARIDFNDRDNSLVGRLLGIQDIIGFHADNVADLGSVTDLDILQTTQSLTVRPELVEGWTVKPFMVRQAHHERLNLTVQCPNL